MAFIPVADAVQVNFVHVWNAEPAVFGMQFQRIGAWGIASAENLASEVYNWYASELLGQLSSNLVLQQIDVIDLSEQTGFKVEYTLGLPEAGGNVSESMPNNVAAVVTFKTAQRGRAFRGRCFLPGLAENSVNGYSLSSAIIGIIADAFDALSGYLVLSGSDQAVVSRTTNPGFSTAVTGYVVRPTVHTQKRRLPTN